MKSPIEGLRYQQVRTSVDYGSDPLALVNGRDVVDYGARRIVLDRSESGAASFVSAQPETAAPKRSYFMTQIRRIFPPVDKEKAKHIAERKAYVCGLEKEEKQARKKEIDWVKPRTAKHKAFNREYEKQLVIAQNEAEKTGFPYDLHKVLAKTNAKFHAAEIKSANSKNFAWARFFGKE